MASIFDALADGPRRLASIAKETGLSQQEAALRLRIAADEGRVRVANGYFRLVTPREPAPAAAPTVGAIQVRTVLSVTLAGRVVELDIEDARRLHADLGRALGIAPPRTTAKAVDWAPIIEMIRAECGDGATSDQLLTIAQRHHPGVTARQVSAALLYHHVISRTARDGRYTILP
jgi:hypothetical protein